MNHSQILLLCSLLCAAACTQPKNGRQGSTAHDGGRDASDRTAEPDASAAFADAALPEASAPPASSDATIPASGLPVLEDFSGALKELKARGWTFEGDPVPTIDDGQLCMVAESKATWTLEVPSEPGYLAFAVRPGRSFFVYLGDPRAPIATLDFSGDEALGIEGAPDLAWHVHPHLSTEVEFRIDWDAAKYDVRVDRAEWKQGTFAAKAARPLASLTFAKGSNIPAGPDACLDNIRAAKVAPPPCAEVRLNSENSYDKAGNLASYKRWSLERGRSEEVSQYDELGHLLARDTRVDATFAIAVTRTMCSYAASGVLTSCVIERGTGMFPATFEPFDVSSTDTQTYDAQGRLSRVHTAEEGRAPVLETYAYDEQGHLTRRETLRDGKLSELEVNTYDAGLLVTKSRESGGASQTTSYQYDSQGRLVSAQRNGSFDEDVPTQGSATYTYDSEGRLLTKSSTLELARDEEAFVYDTAGRVLTHTRDWGNLVDEDRRKLSETNTYDTQGRLTKVIVDLYRDPDQHLREVRSYAPAGVPKQSVETTTWDGSPEITQLHVTDYDEQGRRAREVWDGSPRMSGKVDGQVDRQINYTYEAALLTRVEELLVMCE